MPSTRAGAMKSKASTTQLSESARMLSVPINFFDSDTPGVRTALGSRTQHHMMKPTDKATAVA